MKHRHKLTGRNRGVQAEPARILADFEALAAQPDHRDIRRTRYDTTIRAGLAAVPENRRPFWFYETLFASDTIARPAAFLGLPEIPVDRGERPNAGILDNLRPTPQVWAAVRETLASVYAFVDDRFGADMPPAWRAQD